MEVQDGHLVLAAGPREKELVQRVPGGRYDRDTGHWVFPLGWATCVAARGVFGARLQTGPELDAWSWAEHSRMAELTALKDLDVNLDLDRWQDLRWWQKPDSNWMGQDGCFLNTNHTGLGKMMETLMALKVAGPSVFPVLIICPNSLTLKWAREFESWGPAHGGIIVVDGSTAQKRKQLAADASVVVINWEALRLHSRLAPFGSVELKPEERLPKELDEWQFRTVVADEAHRCVDPRAKQTRAWWNLAHAAKRSYALTATPLTKKPDDFWSIGHGLWPENFPRKTAWVERYCHAGQNLHGGFEVWGFKADTKAELFSFVDPFMCRRTGEVAGNEEVVPEPRYVTMGSKQAKAYRDLEKEMMTEVDGEFLVAGTPLELRLRLRQAASGVPILGEVIRRDGATGERVPRTGVVGLAKPSCKIDALFDILADEPDEPIVVFAESRKLLDLAAEELAKKKVSHVSLVGGLGAVRLDQLVAQFQEGEAQVALCIYSAVKEGISLGRARHLVRLQVSESMVSNIQSVGRIDGLRRQQSGPIRVTDVITVDTVDEDVIENNLTKAGHLDALLRDRLRRGR